MKAVQVPHACVSLEESVPCDHPPDCRHVRLKNIMGPQCFYEQPNTSCCSGPCNVQVDTLLQGAGVRLLGGDACHAVAFEHPEHQLHPLDLEAAGGQQQCITAAAFVPSSMLASDSESNSSDGGDLEPA